MKRNKLIKVATFMLPILFISFMSYCQTLTIKGSVKDDAGLTLPGVSITIKGTDVGTITDPNGNFSISVSSGADILIFSYVGMFPQEIPVGNQTLINVTLESDIQALEEVVVVGYGVQRKEAVTGSVASIGGEEMNEVPSANITQALQGRIPGVELTQTSSKPGAEMQIRIRGTRSLTASNNPLIVLDGIPFAGSIGDINPNDIKSVDILKDASATAIYGSRGANGVILITTNKGRKEQKPRISYNGYYGMKKAIKYPMMDGPELLKLREIANVYPTNGEDEFDDVNTDWQDLFYRTAITTNHDLSLSGGTEHGSYNFGVGYYLDQAVVPTQQYSRYSLRGGIDQEVGKYLRFGFNTNSNYNLTEGTQVSVGDVLSFSPLANPFNDDGTTKRIVRMAGDDSWVLTRDVLNDLEDMWLKEERAYGSYNTFYGELKIPGVEGLKFRTNIGLDIRQKNIGEYTTEGIRSSNPDTESSAKVGNELTTHWVIENLLTYDRTFAEKHQFNVVALYSAEQKKYNKSEMEAKDIPAEAFQFYNLGHAAGEKIVNADNQKYELSGLLSWMGRVMYSYDNRYMLTATVRSDGSSVLAEGHKWHTYPAVSVGWNIGNEAFMEDVSVINRLKLRVGYGQTSNQAVAPYATLGKLKTRPYNFGDFYTTGAYVEKIPNETLGWEYSETMNYGLDFSVLNNRMSGTIEYYVTKTKELLLDVSLPKTSGVSSYTGNIGQTQNKGIELSLNGVVLKDINGWTWDVGVNLFANRNKLVALNSEQERDEYNSWFVGYPINSIYDYEKIGLWQEGDEYMDILEPGDPADRIGMIKVKYTGDYNADGTPTREINSDDKQIISLEPKFQGGFNTRVAYKALDLSIVGAFQNGGVLISNLYSSMGWLNNGTGRRGEIKKDYWTPDNTGAWYPNPASVKSSENPKYGTTLGYFDASYLKIRAISLGFNLSNNSWLRNAGIDKLRLYVTAQNPFVMFSPYHRESGMDPESNSYGNENSAVNLPDSQKRLLVINASTPQTRNYLVGLNLTF